MPTSNNMTLVPSHPHQMTPQHPQASDSQQSSTSEHAPKTRWQSVSSYVGSLALSGPLGLSVGSEEARNALKYALDWLQYAIHYLDARSSLLRSHITRFLTHPSPPLSPAPSSSSGANSLSLTSAADFTQLLHTIRREIVETLRTVVDVVQRYAGVYLTGEARGTVRAFILGLPSRLAGAATSFSTTSTGQRTDEEANKVLNLATEASNMLRNIMTVLGSAVPGMDHSSLATGNNNGVPRPHDQKELQN